MSELMYVTCNRLLDAETSEYCEYNGDQPLSTSGVWFCPACHGRRYV